jgi:Transglutaminase-like superfamily
MHKYLLYLTAAMTLFFSSNAWGNSVSGTIVMEFDLSAHAYNQETQLWIPYPITDGNQTIKNIHWDGNCASSGVYTDAKFQTPMLYAKWDAGIKNRKLTFSFDVNRQEVIRKDFPEKETAWDPVDYALYLAPTRLGPINGEIKKLADKITKGKSTILEKAKAIYDWTCENTYRNPETPGCGAGDVCKLLKNPGGKCADISSVFIALARAADVPSRDVFGIRLGKGPKQDITRWQHCWAEFFLPGYGWVPVDPADVRKMMLTKNLKLSDQKTSEYRKYFWGAIDPYRIRLSDGRDLELNPPQKGDAVNYLMYPFAQTGDTTLDWLDPEAFKYSIIFRKL